MRTATRVMAAAVILTLAAACGPREDTTFDDTDPGAAPAPEMQPVPPPPPPAPMPPDTIPPDTLPPGS